MKATPRGVPPELNTLIDQYDQATPGVHREIPVRITRARAEKFCTQLGDKLMYRGHLILPKLRAKLPAGRDH